MLVDRLFVECVDLGNLRGPARARDVGGDRLERRAGAPDEEDAGPLPSKGPGDAADPPPAP